MATQSIVEQTISFLSSNNEFNDIPSILDNSLIKSLATNSLGNDLLTAMKQYRHYDGANWTTFWLFELRCYVTPAFQTTIQQNLGALQAAFPQYQIVTWGYPVTWGF